MQVRWSIVQTDPVESDLIHPFEFPLPTGSGKINLMPTVNIELVGLGSREVIFSSAVGTSGIIRNLAWVVGTPAGINLEIKYDGSSTASISLPLLTLGGFEYMDSAIADRQISTQCFESSSPKSSVYPEHFYSGNLRLPIPYTNGIEISLVTTDAASHDLYCNVAWQNTLPSCWNRDLRLMASRSDETISGNIGAFACELTGATSVVKTGGGTFPAGVVAGTVLISPAMNPLFDMLVVSRTNDTTLVVSSQDTRSIINQGRQGSDVMSYSPTHTFLSRAAGERGWIAAVIAGCTQGVGGGIQAQFEADPRFILDGDSEPSLTWTSIEDCFNGSYYFSQTSFGEEGGISSFDPVTNQEFCVYKSFYKWPIRYVNGVRGIVPVWLDFPTTFNWTTLFYVQI
jgi:hypothetical protein